MTRAAAFATFEEGFRGARAPLSATDVTLLEADPFEVGEPAGPAGLRARAAWAGSV